MTVEEFSQDIFEDVIGQETAVLLLKAALEKSHFAPAYLFAGPEGVGRKLSALRFLEGFLNKGEQSFRERRRLEKSNHPDLYWIEPTYSFQGQLIEKSKALEASVNKKNRPQIRLEQIRTISKKLCQKPIEAKKTMVIIEDVEEMPEAASNALLKTLEEPGDGLIILISERPEKLLKTIRSRCQKIPFYRLNKPSIETIFSKMNTIHENKINPFEESHYSEILKLADGSPGAFLKHAKIWDSIPKEIWPKLKEISKEPIKKLDLAKIITDLLDNEQQLWLINWMQQYFWNESKNSEDIKTLEKLRSHLYSYVQPRLAWEVALLELN